MTGTDWNGRTEADYDVKLTDFVRRWVAKYPAKAASLRRTVQARMGLTSPPTGRVSQLALEMEFRDAVRQEARQPTKLQWLRGEK